MLYTSIFNNDFLEINHLYIFVLFIIPKCFGLVNTLFHLSWASKTKTSWRILSLILVNEQNGPQQKTQMYLGFANNRGADKNSK